MRKSFTRLLGLVMLFGLFQLSANAEVKVSPKDGATKAYSKTTTGLTITFDEDVVASSGAVRLSDDSGILAVIPGTDARVSVDGKVVTVDVTAELEEYTQYSVSVDDGAFKAADDATNMSVATWAFMTGDYTAPTLESVVPEKDDVVADQTTYTLVMTFKDATAMTLGSGNVTIYKADGNVWDIVDAADATFTDNGDGTATVELGGVGSELRQLEDLTDYAVTIDAGVVKDAGHNVDEEGIPYAGLTDRTVWVFSTEDFTAPGWTTDYPKVENVTDVAFDVLVNTKEDGTVYAFITDTTTASKPTVAAVRALDNKLEVTAGTDATFSFDGRIKSTTYAVYFVADNDDTEGDKLVKAVTKTGETDKPALAAVFYFDEVFANSDEFEEAEDDGLEYGLSTVSSTVSTNLNDSYFSYSGSWSPAYVPLDLAQIVMSFEWEEEVKIGAGNVVIKRVKDGSVFATIPSTDLNVDGFKDDALVGIPVSGLENATAYYVTMPNTLIVDKYGNKYDGISDVDYWTFTTEDKVAPTYTITPAHVTTDIKKDAKVVLTFDEIVELGSGNWNGAVQFTGSEGTITPDFNVDDNDGKFTEVTFQLDGETWPSNGWVKVIVYENNINDGEPNGNPVSDEQATISFRVEDYEGPYVKEWKPALSEGDGELDASDKAVTIEYTEGIQLLGDVEITAENLWTIVSVKNDADDTNVDVDLAISDDKKKITITPATEWKSGKTYNFLISSDIEDENGNAYADDEAARKASYTVVDLIPEEIKLTLDSDNSAIDGETILPSEDIRIFFKDEARSSVSEGGTWVTVAEAGGDLASVIDNAIILKENDANGADVPFMIAPSDNQTFVLTGMFDQGKTYYIAIAEATKDAAGNVNTANSATFSTLWSDAPEYDTFTPEHETVEVDKKDDLVITFKSPVELNGGYVAGGVTLDDGATPPILITAAEIEISTDGLTVTIDPTADLLENATYGVSVAAGVFLNKDTGNPADEVLAADWAFMTTDTEFDITALSFDGTNGSSDEVDKAGVDSKLTITFAEDAEVGTGYIYIKNADTDAVVERIAVGSDQVTIKDDVVTIVPSEMFDYDTEYFVELDEGAFVDEYGVKSADVVGKTSVDLTDWTFISEDPALEIVSVTPDQGDDVVDGVELTTDIVVEFNREIKLGAAGSIGYVEDDMESPATLKEEKYTIDSDNLVVDGNTLTIKHPTNSFPEDSRIWLYIEADAVVVKTDTDNGITAYDEETEGGWFFYTGDENAPEPTFDPAQDDDNDEDVALDADITITFDEEIRHALDETEIEKGEFFTKGLIDLFKVGEEGTLLSYEVKSFSGNKTIVIDPTDDFDQFAEYTVRINAEDGEGISDKYEHDIDENITNTFKTTDTEKPVVDGLTLAGAKLKIGVSGISVVDDNPDKFYYLVRVESESAAPTAEEIMANGVEMTVAKAEADFEIKSLDAATSYQVFYIATDKYDNVSDVKVKDAETIDSINPLLVSIDPADEAVDVQILPNSPNDTIAFELTFDEDVMINFGPFNLGVLRDQATQSVVPATVSMEAKDEVVMLYFEGDFDGKGVMDLFLEVNNQAIKDLAGNAFAGLYGENAIYFSTEDNMAPEVKKLADVTLKTNQDIVIEFTENVKAGTGTAILYKGGTSASDAIEVFKAADVTFDGKTATLNPAADLMINAIDYELVVNADFALDLSTNENGNSLTEDLFFGVDENEAPYIVNADSPGSISVDGDNDPISKYDLNYFDFNFNEEVYADVDGIETNIAFLSDAFVKANNIISVTDKDGNVIDYQFSQCCSDDITFYLDEMELEHNNAYTITIQGLMDDDGVEMTPWSITIETTDGVVPVGMFDPDHDTEDVMEDKVLTITFTEKIYYDIEDEEGDDIESASGDFVFLTKFDNDNIDYVVYLQNFETGEHIPFDATIENDSIINIVPTSPLESGVTYIYGFDESEMVDADGHNPFDGMDSYRSGDKSAQIVADSHHPGSHGYDLGDDIEVAEAVFTVLDFEAPEFDVLMVSPLGSGVTAKEDMYIIFDEAIMVGDGSVIIRNLDGTYSETVSGSDLTVDGDDPKQLNVAHADFPPKMEFFVELTAGVVTDKTGNPSAAFVEDDPEEGAWAFTTKDTYALEAATSPMGDNQPDIVDLVLTFNKDVMVATSSFGYYIAVYKEDGTAVKQIDVDELVVRDNTVTYYGLVLDVNQAYYARVEPKAFKDDSGNMFAGIMDNTWEFSTMDNIAPVLQSTTPADDATDVDPMTTFTMTFDRDVAAGTGDIEVRYFADGELFEAVDVTTATIEGATVTFDLGAPLDADTEFYVIAAEGVLTNTEATADAWEGIVNTYTWDFTTGVVLVYPELASYTPQDTIDGTHPEFEMTFAENVMFGAAGTLTVTEKDSTEAHLVIDITADMIVDNVVTIPYDTMVTGGLGLNTTYIVNVDAGVLVNEEGNAWKGISTDTDWTFTTGDEFTTGIDDKLQGVEFMVYPNPFNDRIKIDNFDKLTRVVITNIAGQRVLDIEYPSYEIRTSNLTTGVYVVSMFTENGMAKSERIIKR